MQAKVTCRVNANGSHAFYVNVNGKEYFLFNQENRRSVGEYFKNGISINKINRYSGIESLTIKKTLDKLPAYLHYIEKEYDVVIYKKTKERQEKKKNIPYRREQFKWQDFIWEVV